MKISPSNTLSTKQPGVCILSTGSLSTTCSASAIVIFAQPAMFGLKLRAALRYLKLPYLSAINAFTKQKSHWSKGGYNKYSSPSKTVFSNGSVTFFGVPSAFNLSGLPPYSKGVATPAGE